MFTARTHTRFLVKICFFLSALLALSACGGGDSDSGGGGDVTTPGDMLPANFVGVYTGVLNLTASAAGLTESDSFPITITVNADGTVRFDGDDPDETFTVGIDNSGSFSGSVTIQEEPCAGTINLQGSVDGSNATGTVSGEGTCTQDSLTVDVSLSGDFNATK